MSARDDILGRIRAAGPLAAPPVGAAYRRAWAADAAALSARFVERLTDYHVGVVRAAEAEIAATAQRQLEARHIMSLAVPADLPAAWRPEGVAITEDAGLSYEELNGLQGALTGSFLGIAETGTIVLNAGVAQGRRALTLLPDYHLCILFESQLVGIMPEAIDKLAQSARAGAPITFFSGPSATADIELDRVAGVHGPRKLDVILVGA